jgi:hypothetical protein
VSNPPIEEAEPVMSLRSLVAQPASPEPPHAVSISTPALLIAFILVVVAVATYRDPRLAAALGTACAVGALLVVVTVL